MDEESQKDTSDRNLTCVLFPGIVKNDEKAIKCLGGIRAISMVETQPTKKRLGLSFNPDNPMSKKIFADNKKVSGVLFKLKVKKTKVGDEIRRDIISTSVVARVQNMHKFESMCDYQYLPITEAPEGEQKCLIDQIIPTGLDNVDFMNQPAPPFIMPLQFSRTDKPCYYSYVDKKYVSKQAKDNHDDVHNRVRNDRSVPSSIVVFDLVSEWPTEPNELIVSYKDKRLANDKKKQEEFDTLKKLFEQRPIWSISLIKFKTNIRHLVLKFMLPCLAICTKNGPWRNLWIRFGYDPRKDPASRIYQILDFRFRHEGGFHTLVECRDSKVHQKRADRVFASSGPRADHTTADEVLEGAVIFRVGRLPTQRQIYYQYCDIEVPEVQAMISAAPGPGALCHATRGWLPPGCDVYCRDHMFKYVKETLVKTRNTDIKLELQNESSDEAMNSDDGEASTSAMDVDL